MKLRLLTPVMLVATALAGGCQTPKPASHHFEGNQYARDGLLREAADSYRQALSKNPGHKPTHRNLGVVLVKIGNYKDAIKHLEAALPAYRNNYPANFYLAEAYRMQERYAEAIHRYQNALEIRPGHERTLKALAWSYFQIRFYSEALEVAQQLRRSNDSDDQGLIILLRTKIKLRQYTEALTLIRSEIGEVAAKNLPYFESLEGDIHFARGEVAKAAKLYRRALKQQPLLAGALLGLGKCYLHAGQKKKAIAALERAVRLRSRLTEGYLLLARAHEGSRPSQALRYYKAFYRRGASDPEFLEQIPGAKKKIAHLRRSGVSG